MAKTATATKQLSKGAKVVARTNLRDVPEGTPGRVQLVNGFAWTRYWVRFDNDVSIGSIDRKVLATADEWKRFKAGEPDVFGDAPVAADGDGGADAAGADGGAAGGGKATPSGTVVPQKLLDRSAAARARLGG
ncbi:MAG: hypothetical protein KDB02_09485 [Acidimicrobiales bacterium]|nr:hypothetical protein [Acidimicrobiales bacterium]